MGYNFKATSCSVCGSNDRAMLGRRVPRSRKLNEDLIADIVICRNCGLLYPYPMPFADEEQLKKNYGDHDTYFPSPVSEGRVRSYELFVRKINRLVPSKGRLLDVGCGRGELLYAARNHGWEVEGVDISGDFARFAKVRFNIDVKVGDLGSIGFAPDTFDAVSLIAVLDHAYHPAELLLELHRILKKGGVIFIEVSNSASLLYKLGNMYYKLQRKGLTTNLSPTFPSFQVYGFSKKSMRFLLEVCGFRILGFNIRGGISRTERSIAGNLRERILRIVRKGCFVLSDILGRGQVLEVYAVKD